MKYYTYEVLVTTGRHVAEIKTRLWEMCYDPPSADILWGNTQHSIYWESGYELVGTTMREYGGVIGRFGIDNVSLHILINGEKRTLEDLEAEHYDMLEDDEE